MSEQTRVLIVEDSATQIAELTFVLSQYDIDVTIARDGQEGLQVVAELKPDFIVLDLNLPKINGLQLCRRVKRDPETAHIPVVIFTASDGSDAMLQGLDSGADDYIPKDDFAIETLLATMQAFGIISISQET